VPQRPGAGGHVNAGYSMGSAVATRNPNFVIFPFGCDGRKILEAGSSDSQVCCDVCIWHCCVPSQCSLRREAGVGSLGGSSFIICKLII